MTPGWETVQLGQILKRSTDRISLAPNQTYREVTVRMNGKGVVQRRTVTGAEIASDHRFVVREGQFIISRIDARNGASGLIPKDLDGAIVTNDFPVFDFVESRIDARFFQWMTKTPAFVSLCKRASEGTTNRVRLDEERFSAIKIALPSVEEQSRVIAQIDQLEAKITEALKLRTEIAGEREAFWPSLLNKAFRGEFTTGDSHLGSALELIRANRDAHASFVQEKSNNAHPHQPVIVEKGIYALPHGWIWTTLGSVLLRLVDCVNDTPEFVDYNSGFLGLKSTNIRPYLLDLRQKWFVSEVDFKSWNRREAPQAGDIVLTREAPVGKACFMPDGTVACLTQRLMLVRPDPLVIVPDLLLHYLNSPVFLDQVLEHSRGLTTPHIRVQDAPKFLLPLPPMSKQIVLAAKLAELQTHLNEVRQSQSHVDRELNAMLPAILDKAFSGAF